MEQIGTGAGLAALGFWLFIAAMAAVGVWSNIRKRDAQHETLRRVIESGQPIDMELTDKLLALTGDDRDLERDLKVSAWLVAFIAPGLLLMGWIMSLTVAPEMLHVMLGVAVLLGFISAGLFVASYVVGQWSRDEEGSVRHRA